MKKFIIGAAMLALAATSLFAEGKVLNVYCWNDEFASRFNDYYKAADFALYKSKKTPGNRLEFYKFGEFD